MNLNLAHLQNQYDLVHCRSVSAGIFNYSAFVSEVMDVLRPGGIFISVDCWPYLFDENFERMENGVRSLLLVSIHTDVV